MFYTLRGESNSDSDIEKILAVIEVVVLIFITTFIPGLIKLGTIPTKLEDVWIEFLVALLASAFAYMRIRGIKPPPQPTE